MSLALDRDPEFSYSIIRDLRVYQHPVHDVLNIGHRGASAYYPENTMVSFRAASEMKADFIELDVQLTKDGIPVVIHDVTVNRTTNGRGDVARLTYNEIRQLDAGSWFSREFIGEKIPRLEEVLEFAQNNINLNIEIKANPKSKPGATEAKTLELVQKYDMISEVLFSSFNVDSLKLLRKINTEVIIGLLFENSLKQRVDLVPLIDELKIDSFHCSKRNIRKKRIREMHSKQIPVMVYTVNAKTTMNKLIEWGINGIFTNKPDVLHSVLKGMNL